MRIDLNKALSYEIHQLSEIFERRGDVVYVGSNWDKDKREWNYYMMIKGIEIY